MNPAVPAFTRRTKSKTTTENSNDNLVDTTNLKNSKRPRKGQTTLTRTLRRTQIYLKVTVFVTMLGMQSLWLSQMITDDQQIELRWLLTYIGGVNRMGMCIAWFVWLGWHKKRINDQDSTTEDGGFWPPLLKMLFMAGPMDATLVMILPHWPGVQDTNDTNLLLQFVWFIPKSLVIELTFDFFHYWAHRLCHWSPWLLKNVHAEHHTHEFPGPLSTYEQSVPDIILTNVIPILIALRFGPGLTITQMHWLLAYKSYIEIAGHSGLDMKGPTFPQMPLLGYLTPITMEVHDHDRHHTKRRVNFSKRFKIWDLVFGSYSPA